MRLTIIAVTRRDKFSRDGVVFIGYSNVSMVDGIGKFDDGNVAFGAVGFFPEFCNVDLK